MARSADPAARVHFAHRLLRARDWQHRPQLDELRQWWRERARGVCALIGIGGAGKTAVAERFLRVLPGAMPDTPDIPKDDSLPPPSSLFVFSFYDAPNPDKFFAELATWLAGETSDESAKTYSYEQTVRLLEGAGECLLVMDGLEKVQDPGARGGAFGRIEDGRLRNLVLRVAEGLLPGVCVIITTRFRLYDPLAERSPLYWPIPVEQLDGDAAVALLRKRGVNRGTDDQLRAVARDQGFHALSVDLVGGYIAHFCDGDPARMPPDPHDQPATEADASLDPQVAAIQEQEHKFARLTERYHDALSKSDPAAIALLQRVCLFRLGVDAKTLASIFTGEGKEGISGPELANLSFEELGTKLQKLAVMRLIEATSDDKRKRSAFTIQHSAFSVHPAVRDGFLAGLDAETAQRAHDAAREGLEASLGGHPGRDPSDPATLDLLEEIVYHTLAAGHAKEAWDIYWNRIGAYKNLLWRLGAYERGERICRAFAGGRAPQQAPLPDGLRDNDRATCVNEWALYLKELGQLDAAARCHERSIEIRILKEKCEHASTGKQNLCNVLLLAGRLTAGLRGTEEALRHAERGSDVYAMCNSHTYRGQAWALRGECEAALGEFQDSLQWQREADGEIDRPLYSGRGIRQAVLLARLGQNEAATRLTEANKKILLHDFGPQDNEVAPCNLILADLARERGELGGARELLGKAHEWAIARDAKEPLCWSALVGARIELSVFSSGLSDSGEHRRREHEAEMKARLEQARSAIEEGLRIARDCGFGIFHIDLLLTRAQVALHEGSAADAERDVRVALDEGVHPPADSGLPELLSATDEECGYAWGIAEGRHLLAEALLLQAAQTLGQTEFAPARFDQLPPVVCDLINQARAQLSSAVDLWRSLKDPESDAEINPHGEPTLRMLEQLDGGALTNYPLTRVRPEPQSDDSEIEKRKQPMPEHQFNRNRLNQLAELLEIQYDVLHDFEKELEMATGPGERVGIRQRIKRDLTPRLREREREYAELLAAGTSTESIPTEDAEPIVAELVQATADIERYRKAEAPEMMLSLLEEIKQKLAEPGKSAAGKLKVALPIIPMVASYDLELDTENFLVKIWRKTRDLFQRLVQQNLK